MKKTDTVLCSNCGFEMIEIEKVCPSCGTPRSDTNPPGWYDNEQFDTLISGIKSIDTSLKIIKNDIHYFKKLSIISAIIFALLILVGIISTFN